MTLIPPGINSLGNTISSLAQALGPNVMMSLGKFQFGISTAAYQELTRSTKYRWPAQDRFNQGQALQFVGPGEDTITLPGVIYPEYRGGTGQLDLMRILAATGTPLPLLDGKGNVLGNWVIESVEEKQSVFAGAGVPRKQEFTLGLRKYGDLPTGATTSGAKNALQAAAAAIAAVQGAANTISNALGLATKLAANLSTAINSVNGISVSLGPLLNSVLSPLTQGLNVANGLANTSRAAQNLVPPSSGTHGTSATIANQSALTMLLTGTNSAVLKSSQAGASLKTAAATVAATPGMPAASVAVVNNALATLNQLIVSSVDTQLQTTAELAALTPTTTTTTSTAGSSTTAAAPAGVTHTYITSDSDTADLIAFNYYGNTDNGIVEMLLAANPGLADYGPFLPAGITVALPPAPTAAASTGTKLWS